MQGEVGTPINYRGTDYVGRTITIDWLWGPLTGLLISATINRAAGCMFGTLYIGLGADGMPNTSPAKLTAGTGSTTILLPVLLGMGLATKDDVLGKQITAGP